MPDTQQLEQRIRVLEGMLNALHLSDKFLFQKPIIGGPNGLRLGQKTGDKIAFYASAPVAQWSSGTGRQDVTSNTGSAMNVGCKFDGNTGTTYYSVGDIVAALKTYGLLAS